jgi:hypothetical protein
LETISSILFRIQSSETDAEVLQSYKLGATTLAAVMATKGEDGAQLLSRDNVESTMDRLADVFADQEEVDEALSAGTDSLLESTLQGGLDEDELMAELEALTESRGINTEQLPAKQQPMASSPVESKSSTGKRVAEIPEEVTVVKQRKVSQATIHSQRGNTSADSAGSSEEVSPIPSAVSEDVESPMLIDGQERQVLQAVGSHRMEADPVQSSIAASSSLEAAESTVMATSNHEEREDEESELVQEEEELSTQDNGELHDLMAQLEELHAPVKEPTSAVPSMAKNSSSLSTTSNKAQKETRMMEA